MIGQAVLVNPMYISVNHTGVQFTEPIEAAIMAEYILNDNSVYIGIELTTKKCIHFQPMAVMQYPGVQVAKGVIANSNGGSLLT